MKKSLALVALVAALSLTGCAGMRSTGSTFTAHAESFRLFSVPIPQDDLTAATAQVPAGATITNVNSTSADWTSLTGFFGNLFGFHTTLIGGTK